MLSTPLESGAASVLSVANALCQIDRWFCNNVGASGVAIYEAVDSGQRLAYESEEFNGTPWPIRAAMEAGLPRTIGPFTIAPLRASGRRIGAFIALTPNAVFARRWLDDTARAAEVVSIILAASASAPSMAKKPGDCR